MKYFLYIILLLVGVSSCTNVLDVTPETSQTYATSFKSEKDFWDVLTAINGGINGNFLSQDLHIKTGILVDTTYDNSIRNAQDLDPKTMSVFPWSTDYDVIYLANVILENLYRDADLSADRTSFYSGQAHFAKALMYFSLARKYGDAVITTDISNFNPYARSTAAQVLDEAIKDATQAYAELPNYSALTDYSGSAITVKQYGCKGSTAALLAHLYAWKGSMADLYHWPGVDAKSCYDQGAAWCTKIITGETGNYSFEPSREAYVVNENSGVMNRNMATESIFELQNYFKPQAYSGDLNLPITMVKMNTWPLNPLAGTGDIADPSSVSTVVRKSTVDALYETNDQRKNAYFCWNYTDPNTGVSWTYDEALAGGNAYPYKWRTPYLWNRWGSNHFGGPEANLTYWRLSGIYLLRAECYNNAGNTAMATQDLNKIRANAGATAFPATGETNLKYAIFREREKELIWEGQRYYDVVRNHYYSTELSPAIANLSDGDIQGGALYLPVSKSSFTNNDLMRQTPYWLQFKY